MTIKNCAIKLFIVGIIVIFYSCLPQGGTGTKPSANSSKINYQSEDEHKEIVEAISLSMDSCRDVSSLSDFSLCIKRFFSLADFNLQLEPSDTNSKGISISLDMILRNSGKTYVADRGVLGCDVFKNKTFKVFSFKKDFNHLVVDEIFQITHTFSNFNLNDLTAYYFKCYFEIISTVGSSERKERLAIAKDFYIDYRSMPISNKTPLVKNSVSMGPLYIELKNGVKGLFTDLKNSGSDSYLETGILNCSFYEITNNDPLNYLSYPVKYKTISNFSQIMPLPSTTKVEIIKNIESLTLNGTIVSSCYLANGNGISEVDTSGVITFIKTMDKFVPVFEMESPCSLEGHKNVTYKCVSELDSNKVSYSSDCLSEIRKLPNIISVIVEGAENGRYQFSQSCTLPVEEENEILLSMVLIRKEECPLCLESNQNFSEQRYKEEYQCKKDDNTFFDSECYEFIETKLKEKSNFLELLRNSENNSYIAYFSCTNRIPNCVYKVERFAEYDSACGLVCNDSWKTRSNAYSGQTFKCIRQNDGKAFFNDDLCLPLISNSLNGKDLISIQRTTANLGDGLYEAKVSCIDSVPQCYRMETVESCNEEYTEQQNNFLCKDEFLEIPSACRFGKEYTDYLPCLGISKFFEIGCYSESVSNIEEGLNPLSFERKLGENMTIDQCGNGALVQGYKYMSFVSQNETSIEGTCYVTNQYNLDNSTPAECLRDERILSIGTDRALPIFQLFNTLNFSKAQFRGCFLDENNKINNTNSIEVESFEECANNRNPLTKYLAYKKNSELSSALCLKFDDINYFPIKSEDCIATGEEEDGPIIGNENSISVYCSNSCECAYDLPSFEYCTGKCGESCQGRIYYACPRINGRLYYLVREYLMCCYSSAATYNPETGRCEHPNNYDGTYQPTAYPRYE